MFLSILISKPYWQPSQILNTVLTLFFSLPGITALVELLILEHFFPLNLEGKQIHPFWTPKEQLMAY